MRFLAIFGAIVWFLGFMINFNRMYISAKGKWLPSFFIAIIWPLWMIVFYIGIIVATFNASRGK